MDSLDIIRMGQPILRAVASDVADPADPAVRMLAEEMTRSMLEAPGVGLAAPQVGRSLRLMVYRIPSDRSGGETVPPSVLINPQVVPLGDEIEFGLEGCLSIPGLRGMVPRYRRIGYRGLDLEGRLVEREAEGFHARVIQHETDHLDGILYIDRMVDLRQLAFTDEVPDMFAALHSQSIGRLI